MTTVFDFSVRRADGSQQSLADYRGQVLLIVNTASRCGFTPQYAGLEALYRRYREQGLTVLAFPCNQFGAQEPGSAEEIASFCSLNYDVSFPVFARIEVNGPQADPLFRWLKQEQPGWLGTAAIKWNVTKCLVDRQGRAVGRYGPRARPEALARAIEARLALP